ncbi:UNVERIFIED_CONTAM: hypothetical protein NCL1_39088 [Trichonephila clavipes]
MILLISIQGAALAIFCFEWLSPYGYDMKMLPPRGCIFLYNQKHLSFVLHYSDTIDESNKLQLSAIPLSVPPDAVPGTESCMITAVGIIRRRLQNSEMAVMCPLLLLPETHRDLRQ